MRDADNGPPAHPGPPRATAARSLRKGLLDGPIWLVLADITAVLLSARTASWRSSLVLAALSVSALAAVGLYRRRLILSALDDALRVVPGIGMAWVAAAWAAALVPGPGGPPASRLWWWLVVAACVVLARAGVYSLLRRGRARRPRDVLLVGPCVAQVRLAERLLQRPELGLRPIGFVGAAQPARALPLPVLGPIGALDDIVAQTRAEHVVVGFGATRDAQLVPPLRRFRQRGGTVFVVPRLFELNAGPGAETVDGIPLVRLPPVPSHRWSWLAKRALDVVGAAVGLVIAAPLLLACAVAVRRETGRDGVLFRQRRVGQHGRPFPIIKFRSLTPGSEAESQQRWSVDDCRIGPVGRMLRRSCLDELPQLVNVLRGDMSLVGPRPERPFFVNLFGDTHHRYLDRHRVPPGMTGWAQVHGLRGDTSIEARTMLDNFYIENWSLALDVKIMLRTLPAILRSARRGAP